MKEVLDNFSAQPEIYKKFRPTYPKALFDEVLQYVFGRKLCWDCGTGNGQIAVELSKYFEKVCASDLSPQQIAQAEKRENIFYSSGRSEKTDFEDHIFDLVTVGQAIHWFDIPAFNREVKRVVKSGGLVAFWGYSLLGVDEGIDQKINEFYYETIGKYWDKERGLVDDRYETIAFDFEELPVNKDLTIHVKWDLKHLEGYLNSWSAVQNYMRETGKGSPVPKLIKALKSSWGDNEFQDVRFPVFLRVGRIN
jgi:ubiquinone/menaquinone biosynthesis C-methylase UbiE